MAYEQFPDTAFGFVHKRIFGGVKSFIGSGFNPLAAIGGFLAAPPKKVSHAHELAAPGHPAHGPLAKAARSLAPNPIGLGVPSIVAPANCQPPLVRDTDGECRFPGSPADISVGGSMGGAAIMGRYGAALAPETESRIHRSCLPGMVLGDDSLCYNRSQIKNSERKYPKGRRPLLTGGDRNAITRAARAARAIQRTEKQLRKLGMLKSPSRGRRAAPAPRPRQVAPGTSIINVE